MRHAPLLVLAGLLAAAPARAADAAAAEPAPLLRVVPYGYVEAAFAWNLNRPSNGITAYRGFDNRHATFLLQNAVLGANATSGPVSARLALQVGAMPASYYGAEPDRPGAGGVAASNAALWRYLQEAFVTYEAPVGRGLRFQLGLYASPVGYESIPIKDNWTWSHSNLFFGLPFYHTGLRVSYPVTDELTVYTAVFNGWNSVVDNNEAKSVEASVEYKTKDDRALVDVMYLGGIERPSGAPEGPAWRHLFDANARVEVTKSFGVIGHADYGFESNRFGTARWWAAALYTRVSFTPRLRLVLRADRFHEHLATGARGTSNPIFWGGAEWVRSGTATFEVKPHENLLVRLEGRHDVAEQPLYYGRDVRGDGTTIAPFVPNGRTQTTITLGASAWF